MLELGNETALCRVRKYGLSAKFTHHHRVMSAHEFKRANLVITEEKWKWAGTKNMLALMLRIW